MQGVVKDLLAMITIISLRSTYKTSHIFDSWQVELPKQAKEPFSLKDGKDSEYLSINTVHNFVAWHRIAQAKDCFSNAKIASATQFSKTLVPASSHRLF